MCAGKRKTKAAIAVERGLEPLADYLWEQTGDQPAGEFAERFINLEKEILTIESAIEGALHIIAERVAETPEFRKQLRDTMMSEGVVRAKFDGVPVSAGQQYWVVVKTNSRDTNTLAAWNFNDTEQVIQGAEAVNDGSGWQPLQSFAAPAFEVLGK